MSVRMSSPSFNPSRRCAHEIPSADPRDGAAAEGMPAMIAGFVMRAGEWLARLITRGATEPEADLESGAKQ
jgi:hypothetical protein